MSSFIVNYRTINRILNYIDLGINDYSKKYIISDLKDKLKIRNLQSFGVKLLKLNIDAVNQRYNENQDYSYALGFRFEPFCVLDIQGLKSLRCLLYQCDEGNVPKRKIFKVLEQFSLAMAYQIVGRLEEYEKSEWG